MSRIRTIKPEFPQSETIGRLSRDARLLFVQLWTIADDAGRLRGASRMLASLLYPYDNDAAKLMSGWLEELEQKECIRRYVVDGSQYVEITKWLKHQKIDRPSTSRLPAFVEGSVPPREQSRALDADLVPSTGTSTKDQDHLAAWARFEKFWSEYPKTPPMSKKEAAREWQKLSDEDQVTALEAVQPYRDWLKKEKDPKIVHACRFLSQRRFDGFKAEVSKYRILAPRSPEWDAQRAAMLERGEKVYFMDQQAEKGNGWPILRTPVKEAAE